MTKSSKLIATLGVVAGLGVAALPLGSVFAATVTGQAVVEVEVQPAIAMTIVGNNDAGTHGDTSTTNASVNAYSTGDTNVSSGTNPLISGAINAGPSSSYISILPNSKKQAGEDATFKSAVTVATNNLSGYTLKVKGAGTSLVNTADNTKTIATGTTLSEGSDVWGYAVNDAPTTDGATAPAAALTATDTVTEINTTDALISTFGYDTAGRTTDVYYGVSTDPDQAQGVYTQTLTYTATTQ